MNYKNTFALFLLLFFYNALQAQTFLVTATSSTDGKSITINCQLGITGANPSYAISVSGPFSNVVYGSFNASITVPSSPGLTYNISVVASYGFIGDGGRPYTAYGQTSVLTSTPAPGSPPGNNNSCPLTLHGLTFEDFNADGSPRPDGSIIISFSPLLNSNGWYVFRYRLAGTSPWTTSGYAQTKGFVYNGHTYGYYVLNNLVPGGVEYEIQVAYVCAIPANTSDYSSSYYTYTLFD